MIIARLGRSGAINCGKVKKPKKNEMYHKKQLSQITAIHKMFPLFEDMPILLKKFAKVRKNNRINITSDVGGRVGLAISGLHV